MTMTRFAFLDAVSRLDDEILDAAAEQRKVLLRGLELRSAMGQDCHKKSAKRGGSGRKSPLRWIIPIAAAVLLVGAMIPVGLYFFRGPAHTTETTQPNVPPTPVNSDVHLSAIIGKTLLAQPDDLSQPNSASVSTDPLGIALLAATDEEPPLITSDIASIEIQEELPQTLVLFDDEQYANLEIQLDNPYDYYIADFYMICSEPDAQIYVDNRWIPLDGSVKIRWTGSTNKSASYYIYLPVVNEGANITLTDMRYLNNTEIAVDMQSRNVATVCRMDFPVKTTFMLNQKNGYYFRIIQSEQVVSMEVENAKPATNSNLPEYNDLYVVKESGLSYTIHFSYSIPGTDIVCNGVIKSPEITLLTKNPNFTESVYYYKNPNSDDYVYIPNANMQIYLAGIQGSMFTGGLFRAPNEEEIKAGFDPERYPFVLNPGYVTVSINGNDPITGYVIFERRDVQDDPTSFRYSWECDYVAYLYVNYEKDDVYNPYTGSHREDVNADEERTYYPVKIYWNGKLFFSGQLNNWWPGANRTEW